MRRSSQTRRSVTLTTPTGSAVIGRATATGTIINDDSTCSLRPRVFASPAAGGGALNVHVESSPTNTPAVNPISQLKFGTFLIAKVTLNGQPIVSGQTFTPPANATSVDFTVTRATPGSGTNVAFTVVDSCGEWPTFVGGGTSAGFKVLGAGCWVLGFGEGALAPFPIT